MDSPPLKVTYDELPERASKVLYDNTWHAKEHEGVIIATPRRKTRITKERNTRKRPRLDSLSKERSNESGHTPEGMSCTDTLPALRPLPLLDDFTNSGNGGANFGDWREDEADPPQNVDITYASFVDAVLSDECSFYQLSQRVFVANGWNPGKNETNVRDKHIEIIVIDRKFLSLHGITYRGRRL